MSMASLLSLSSPASATEKILKPGDRAPFKGVLVDEIGYRAYVRNERESKEFQSEIEMLNLQLSGLEANLRESEQDKPSRFGWFMTGLAAGLAAVLAVKSR